MGLSSFKFSSWAPKKPFLKQCVIAVQDHPKSLIMSPIESAYATSYLWSIASLVLSRTVSEIRRRIGRKHQFSLLQSHLTPSLRSAPFEFLHEPHVAKTRFLGQWRFRDPSLRRFDTVPAPDIPIMASTGLCVVILSGSCVMTKMRLSMFHCWRPAKIVKSFL